MGQALKTLASGSEEKKGKEIGPIIEESYLKYIAGSTDEIVSPGVKYIARSTDAIGSPDFYQAVCQTVEEINKRLGYTQLRVPQTETLKRAYEKHHQGKGKSLTKEEFQKIMEEVIVDTAGLTSFGAKDIIFYMFGVPATALVIKQGVAPKTVPNDIFIPVVTSATVFLLAKLNKI